ncbi:porin family protein [Flavobacterium humi]|uniref:PorT family protein n=1 Tax=Flavobacterium humi TaxID=2562683 RepID=A0A4Z0L6K3_9FLAO|nr:porin family protein [Flavobacterium humi]TGD58027.1 PorT family protein [Flavobacterium humi]
MRKNVFLIAALFALGMANAQEAVSTKPVRFGVKSGVNVASVDGISSPILGFHIGGVMEYKFNEKFGIQSEIFYSLEGGKDEFDDEVGGTQYHYVQEITLNNINFPVMFKYYPTAGFSVEAGPQIGFIVKANDKSELRVPDSNAVGRTDGDMSEDQTVIVVTNGDGSLSAAVIDHDYKLNKINFSVNVGVGYELKSGMFFQARYNLGLTDFTENRNVLSGNVSGSGTPVVPNHYGESLKASSAQISVGYKF